jgi:hypothetical protein
LRALCVSSVIAFVICRACCPRFSASLSLRLAVVIFMNCQHHLAVKHITQREIRFYLVIAFRRKNKVAQ